MPQYPKLKLSALRCWYIITGKAFSLRLYFKYTLNAKVRTRANTLKHWLAWRLFKARILALRAYHLRWLPYYFLKRYSMYASLISIIMAILGAPAFAPVLTASTMGAMSILGVFFVISFIWCVFLKFALDIRDFSTQRTFELGQDDDYDGPIYQDFDFKEYVRWSHT